MKNVTFAPQALEDFQFWLENDKKTIRKIMRLIKDIQRNGLLVGIGQPEKLKFRDDEYSRRINHSDRLIYTQKNDDLYIYSCRGHYDD